MSLQITNRVRVAGLSACAVLALSAGPAFSASADAAVPAEAAEPTEAGAAEPVAGAPEAAPERGGDISAPTVRWEALKTRLAAKGLEVGAGYVSDVTRLPGQNRAIGRGLTTTSLTADLDKMAGLKGVSAYVSHLWKRGADGSAAIPLAQGFSNIDEADFGKVYEAFVEKKFERLPLRVKAGQVDANTEFAVVEGGSNFINPSMGFSPTIFLLPTYPDPAPSVNVFVDPVKHLNVGVGVYGNQAGAARWRRPFVIGQATGTWSAGEGLAGYASVGGWRQSIEGGDGVIGAHSGTFGVLQQTVWQSNPGSEQSRSLTVFGQFGFTGSSEAEVGRHLGFGASWKGLLPRRPEDAFGFGVTAARMGAASEFSGASEVSAGPFYRLKVTEGLMVGPDVQFVRHPGGDPSASAMTVFTLRMTAEF